MARKNYEDLYKDWREFGGVYVIENRKTGDVYIGQSSNCLFRWWSHLDALRSGNHSNKHLQKAYNSDGLNSFNFRIDKLSPRRAARLRFEADLIQAYQIRGRFVYNIETLS
jgi:hypothetical protein